MVSTRASKQPRCPDSHRASRGNQENIEMGVSISASFPVNLVNVRLNKERETERKKRKGKERKKEHKHNSSQSRFATKWQLHKCGLFAGVSVLEQSN